MGVKKVISLDVQEKFASYMQHVSDIDAEIFRLQEEKIKYQTAMAEIKLSPFKVGDEVMCEVSSGRSRKMQKCLIEVEDGVIYVRPYKNDGELSNRHFNIQLVEGKTYADYFKKV